MCYFKTGVTPNRLPFDTRIKCTVWSAEDHIRSEFKELCKSGHTWPLTVFSVQHLEHCCMLRLLMLGTKGLEYFLKGF